MKEGEFYETYLKAKNRVEYLEEKVYKQYWIRFTNPIIVMLMANF